MSPTYQHLTCYPYGRKENHRAFNQCLYPLLLTTPAPTTHWFNIDFMHFFNKLIPCCEHDEILPMKNLQQKIKVMVDTDWYS